MVALAYLSLVLLMAALSFWLGFYVGSHPSEKIEIPKDVFHVEPPLPEAPIELVRRRRMNAEENAMKRDQEREAEKRRPT